MRVWGTVLALLAFALPASAQVTFPERPGERAFVLDEADLIDEATQARLVQVCDTLLTESAVPIVVVTIESMGAYGARGWNIERYAHNLFDEWGIGYAQHNRGILLLVSKGDRKVRIQLGADWGGGKHARSQEIMDTLIIPQFKRGAFGQGIEVGVAALDAMVRDIAVPSNYRRKTPAWVVLMWIGFIALAVFTAVSLYRRGASGYAWVFWGLVFTILFMVLRGLAHASKSSGGGGSFGGGSFGGGFSGGGGATGSW